MTLRDHETCVPHDHVLPDLRSAVKRWLDHRDGVHSGECYRDDMDAIREAYNRESEPTAISTLEQETTETSEPTAISLFGAIDFRGHPITCGICSWGRATPENFSWAAYWKHMDETHQLYQPFGERK